MTSQARTLAHRFGVLMPEDVSHVRDFFSHWAAYEAAVQANYLHHREMAGVFNAVLKERGHVGSMLDLGAVTGDRFRRSRTAAPGMHTRVSI